MDNPLRYEPVYRVHRRTGLAWRRLARSGARNFYMSKAPVKRIEDLRAGSDPASCRVRRRSKLKPLGAFAHRHEPREVYTSLQQGILDGAENNEFAHHRSPRRRPLHLRYAHPHSRWLSCTSTFTLEKLTPEQQRIVEAAIKASIEFEKAAWDKEIEKTKAGGGKDFNVEFSTRSTKTLSRRQYSLFTTA